MSFVYAKIKQKLYITRQIYEKYCDLADYDIFFTRKYQFGFIYLTTVGDNSDLNLKRL